MRAIVSTLPQPSYSGKPEDRNLVVGTLSNCNFYVMDNGKFPYAVIEIPVVLENPSIDSLKAGVASYADMSHVSEVKVTGNSSTDVFMTFNKNGDFSLDDARSDNPAVRELNNLRQQWTTEEIMFEVLTFINGLLL